MTSDEPLPWKVDDELALELSRERARQVRFGMKPVDGVPKEVERSNCFATRIVHYDEERKTTRLLD